MASPIAKYEDATLRKVLAVTLDPMPSDNVPALHLAALAEVCLGRRRRSCLRQPRLPGVAVQVPTPSPGWLSHLSDCRTNLLAIHTPVRLCIQWFCRRRAPFCLQELKAEAGGNNAALQLNSDNVERALMARLRCGLGQAGHRGRLGSESVRAPLVCAGECSGGAGCVEIGGGVCGAHLGSRGVAELQHGPVDPAQV
jgi:hypothetical protein